MQKITFNILEESKHLAILHKWLNEPHVVEHWHSAATLEEVKGDFFAPSNQPDLAAESYFISDFNGEPFGFIQTYWTMQSEPGWWEDERAPGTVGIDFFIGNPAYLKRGLAPNMIDAFVQLLFKDQSISRIIADPAPNNSRSIKCLTQAAFRRVGDISTPDGAAVLMDRRR